MRREKERFIEIGRDRYTGRRGERGEEREREREEREKHALMLRSSNTQMAILLKLCATAFTHICLTAVTI